MRRKILRLYRLAPLWCYDEDVCFITLRAKCRDAKSCVSRLGKPVFIDGNMLMEIGFVVRETQDFASLQG